MKKQILLYNIKDKKRALDIRRVLMPLKIRIKQINESDFGQPIGYLADIDGFEFCEDLSGDFSFDDEMMIMVGSVSYTHLDVYKRQDPLHKPSQLHILPLTIPSDLLPKLPDRSLHIQCVLVPFSPLSLTASHRILFLEDRQQSCLHKLLSLIHI